MIKKLLSKLKPEKKPKKDYYIRDEKGNIIGQYCMVSIKSKVEGDKQ